MLLTPLVDDDTCIVVIVIDIKLFILHTEYTSHVYFVFYTNMILFMHSHYHQTEGTRMDQLVP